MTRVEIPIVTFDFATQKVVSGATVSITDRATAAPVTVYADETSGLTLTQPLISDSGGRVDGWLPRGAYLATIDSPGAPQYTEPFDLAPAHDGSIDGAWAGPDIALQADLDAAIASIPPGYNDANMVAKLAALVSGDKIAWETAGGDFVEIWASRVPAGSYASDFEDAYETDPTAVPARITGEATNRTGAGIAYVPADTSVRASGSGAATYIHNSPPAATSDFRATAQIKYDFNQQGGFYIRKSAGVGLLAYVDFASGVAGFYVDTSTDGHRFISSPTLYAVPADPWLQFTKSGNTITLRLFNGDPDAGGVQVGADGSYTFTAGDVATWGTPTYTVGGYIVAAGTPFAAIRTLRHAVASAAETRDLFLAVTSASGTRTVKRLFGYNGTTPRSDFMQLGDLTALSATTPDKLAWEYPTGTDVVELWGERTASSLAQAHIDQFTTNTSAQYTAVSGAFTWDTGNGRLSLTNSNGSEIQRSDWGPHSDTDRLTLDVGFAAAGSGANQTASVGFGRTAATSMASAGMSVQLIGDGTLRYFENGSVTVLTALSVTRDGTTRYRLSVTRNGSQVTVTVTDTTTSTQLYTTTFAVAAGNVATLGAGVNLTYAHIHAAANSASGTTTYADNFTHYTVQPEARDLFVAVTPTGGSRTTKRVFGSSGSASFRSDFAQLASNGGVQLPVYTLATRPAASGFSGSQIFVSDAAAGSKVQTSDGTSWIDNSVEAFHVVGAAGEPAFQNAWVNFGGGLSTVGFYKDRSRVYLKGQAKSGANGTVIFTLPVGYRPSERMDFPCGIPGATSTVAIMTDGSVVPTDTAGNARISLDGISFKL
jgi:hypothetical protein